MLRAAAIVVLAGTATPLLGPAPAAQAHPFGPPLTAHLVPDERRPSLVWHGAEDDWTALGDALGVFADPDPGRTGAQLLSAAPQVREYLEETLRLRQGGADCRSIAEPGDDVVEDGIRVVFDCPLPPGDDGRVELTVESMLDLHAAYRTAVTVEGTGTTLLFTGDEPTQDLTTAGAGSTPALALGGGAVAVALLGAGWLLLRRRRA